jgi:hypothetical protein
MGKRDRVELTDALIESAEPPSQGQRFIRDSLVVGLAVRITAGDVKVVCIRGTHTVACK